MELSTASNPPPLPFCGRRKRRLSVAGCARTRATCRPGRENGHAKIGALKASSCAGSPPADLGPAAGQEARLLRPAWQAAQGTSPRLQTLLSQARRHWWKHDHGPFFFLRWWGYVCWGGIISSSRGKLRVALFETPRARAARPVCRKMHISSHFASHGARTDVTTTAAASVPMRVNTTEPLRLFSFFFHIEH